jgi:hypothetical protein
LRHVSMRCRSSVRHADCPIEVALAETSAIMRYMAYCDLCDMRCPEPSGQSIH